MNEHAIGEGSKKIIVEIQKTSTSDVKSFEEMNEHNGTRIVHRITNQLPLS